MPRTTAGKIIGGLFSLVGVVVFALPAGIIATGLGLQVKENEKLKRKIVRRKPAVKLVISRWRCHRHRDFHSSVPSSEPVKPIDNAKRFIRSICRQTKLCPSYVS